MGHSIFAMIIFLGTVSAVYFSGNYYLYRRLGQAFSDKPRWRRWYRIVLVLLALCYPLGRTAGGLGWTATASLLQYVGGVWLFMLLYLAIFTSFIDIFRLAARFIPALGRWRDRRVHLRHWLPVGVSLLALLVISWGIIHNSNIRVTRYRVTLPGSGTPLRAVLLTDIHLSATSPTRRLNRLADTVSNLKPDLILLGGDTVDDRIGVLNAAGLDRWLHRLQAPQGVYAVTGNHEYIQGKDESINWLRRNGVKVLEDRVQPLPSGILLAGRIDRTQRRRRKPLRTLLQGLDRSKPVVLLDHQPFNLEEAATNGVALQLSGHTHHGQLWPLQLITGMIYECSYGMIKKENTSIIVSSGAGTWGPPVRTSARAEVILLDLDFARPARTTVSAATAPR